MNCKIVQCRGNHGGASLPRVFERNITGSPTRSISLLGTRPTPQSQKHRAVSLEDAVYTYLAAAGDVEAPNGALIVAALGISAVVLLIPFALKPGIDAAEKMQERVRI